MTPFLTSAWVLTTKWGDIHNPKIMARIKLVFSSETTVGKDFMKMKKSEKKFHEVHEVLKMKLEKNMIVPNY